MGERPSLRARKKAETRERIADTAAALFSEHGYDAVSMADVARVADVSVQTAYNYFPSKHELVLDRSEEFRQLFGRLVAGRAAGSSPAQVLRPHVMADIERFRDEDRRLVGGEFPALCLGSGELRRFALEMREQHINTIADAIVATSPDITCLVARAHAAALVSVIQNINDRIGACVLRADFSDTAVAAMKDAAGHALDDLDRTFHQVTSHPARAES